MMQVGEKGKGRQMEGEKLISRTTYEGKLSLLKLEKKNRQIINRHKWKKTRTQLGKRERERERKLKRKKKTEILISNKKQGNINNHGGKLSL